MRLVDIAYYHGLYDYYIIWLDMQSVLDILYQRDRLEGLSAWAKRKRLSKVEKYYNELLIIKEDRLLHYRLRRRNMVFWMEWLHCFKVMLFPPSY